MQNRFKSIVFWASVAAQILSILVLVGVIDVAKSDVINQLIAAALQLFVTFGVLNNPTDKTNF